MVYVRSDSGSEVEENEVELVGPSSEEEDGRRERIRAKSSIGGGALGEIVWASVCSSTKESKKKKEKRQTIFGIALNLIVTSSSNTRLLHLIQRRNRNEAKSKKRR